MTGWQNLTMQDGMEPHTYTYRAERAYDVVVSFACDVATGPGVASNLSMD